MGLYDLLEPGEWVRVVGRYPYGVHSMPSAAVAKLRLRAVIRADRARANEGRWVRVQYPLAVIFAIGHAALSAVACGNKDLAERYTKLLKRYRWQARR